MESRANLAGPITEASECQRSKRPGWLRTESTDSVWYFLNEAKGYASSHFTVSWELAPGAEGPHEHYWRRVAQTYVIAYADSFAVGQKRVTSIVEFARVLRSFVAWACYERMCPTLSEFTRDDLFAYEEHISTLGLTKAAVGARLGALRTVGLLGRHQSDAVSFIPYRSFGELKRVARVNGRPNGKTPTLPPEDFFRLLNHSLVVIDSADQWITAADILRELKSSSRRPSRVARRRGLDTVEVVARTREIYGACLIVLFSLLGLRKHEVACIRVGDARRAVAGEKLAGTVLKSSNGSGGSPTVRPVVPEIRRALELVIRLVGAEDDRDDMSLVRVAHLDAKRCRSSHEPMDSGQVYRLLEQVANSACLQRKVRPHMFRRAFSMIYIWRYELGDLAHLSRFLHHNNIAHTLSYAQGEDIHVFMSDAEKELGRALAERALVGKEAFGGGFGKRLERFAKRLRAAAVVLRPEHVEQWINARASEGDFSLVPGPHGYCVTFRSRAIRAACADGGVGPNLANRTDEHCATCANFLATSRSEEYWRRRIEAHERVLASSRIAVIKSAAKSAILAARRVLASIVEG